MKHSQILKSSALVLIATLILRGLNFIREMTLAATYGAGNISDAFIVAFTLPDLVLVIIASAVSSAFIPYYFETKSDKQQLTRNVISCLMLIGLLFSVVFSIFPQPLVFLFASQLDKNVFELAVQFSRIVLWSAIPILVAAVLRSFLQIKDRFFSSSIADGLISICIIPTILLSRYYLPLMAVGVILGKMASLLALTILSRRNGMSYRFYINLRDDKLRAMLTMMIPVFIISGISDLNIIIDRNFASSLASGAISSLNYANRMNSLIAGLTGMTLATVMFPRISEQAASGDYKLLNYQILNCTKKLIPIVLPVMLGIVILAKPIVSILYERGAFSPTDTQNTAECLRMYALGVFFNCINPILMRAFFAMKNTRTPAICSVAALGIGIVLDILLVGPLQHQGLALATSISSGASVFFLFICLRKVLGPLGLLTPKGDLYKTLLATGVSGVAIMAAYKTLPVMSGSKFQCIGLTVGIVLAAAIIYFAMQAILRTEFLKYSARQVRGLLKR